MTPTLPVEAPEVRCAPPVERPILFSAPMVCALLEGRKTQTRRVCKVQPPVTSQADASWRDAKADLWRNARQYARDCCPYGAPGSLLWVREGLIRPDGDPWLYRADNMPVMVNPEDETAMIVWAHHKEQNYCPSMFMPRFASRITLELTGVRVERVTEISDEDAKAEGVALTPCPHPEAFHDAPCPNGQYRINYAVLWNQINGKTHPWASDPFVWVLTFKRITP